MNNIEMEETNRKVRELFHETEVRTLKKMPLWMRLNYFINRVSQAIADGHTNEDIKWDYVNEMCTADLSPFDYNMFESVSTIEELDGHRFNVLCAEQGIGPWHKHKCKDCGNTFSMMFKEVNFYKEKGLHLPKRCKACRQKRSECK